MHEVRIAGAVRRPDRDFGFGDLRGIGHGREHRDDAGAHAERAELAPRDCGVLSLLHVVENVLIAHGWSPEVIEKERGF